MIDGSDREGSQQYPVTALGAIHPSKGDFITVVGDLGSIPLARRVKAAMREATPLPVESLTAPRSVPGVDDSDHFPYWDAGYPAVMITDTADNRNLAHHTPEDTADRLDYRRMAQVVQGVYVRWPPWLRKSADVRPDRSNRGATCCRGS